MKLGELLADIPIQEASASLDADIRDICYDSRRVMPGDLFVAVEGLKSDGHRFIRSAIEKGAAAVLCQRRPEGDIPYILTPDSRRALALVSAAFFGQSAEKLQMVGVTGTNGKTTSTILIKHMLEDCLGAKVGLIGTISNWIGDREIPAERTTPESYDLQRMLSQMVSAGCRYAVMEVSSHALALDRVEGIRFQAGIFTNLTQDHLDFHGTMEGYAEAKARLFTQCGAGAVNLDDPWAALMARRADCPVMGYSAEGRPEAELSAENVSLSAGGVSFVVRRGEEQAPVRLAIPGRFSVSNALTAVSAGLLLGIPLKDCAASLNRAKGVKGRVELVPTPPDFTMVIDYAHTPDALEKVLRTMREVSDGRLVVLFGCGGDRDATKRPIMGRIAAENADLSIVTSDNPRSEDPDKIIGDILAGMPADAPRQVISSRPAAIGWTIEHHEPGDVIVLAGKGYETYQEVNGEKRHMDEREIVADYLKKSEERTT
ncbi:MAG: UDP-N-acetylmuramoyl-L-alanyl-D-glutamate--2,6-diaminopimelate ligase [Oscillospiraceae bacterium]|nr:UDP-N-acetylmuramoyl-L-alanyl-D-glutamate--2,6-diaminopimelate ligase [Oscillospiraceae bacterium]